MNQRYFTVVDAVTLVVVALLIAASQYWASSNAAQSVTLAWNPNTETNLAGYRLYWGTASRSYTNFNQVLVPSVTSTVTGLSSGATYHFAVTAFTTDALESDYSDEVSYTVPQPPRTKTITLYIEEACDLLGPWDKLTNVTTIVVPESAVFYRGVIEIR